MAAIIKCTPQGKLHPALRRLEILGGGFGLGSHLVVKDLCLPPLQGLQTHTKVDNAIGVGIGMPWGWNLKQ